MSTVLNQLINRTEQLVILFSNEYQRLQENFPGWSKDDLRLTLFGHVMHKPISAMVNLKMVKTSLMVPTWWPENAAPLIPNYQLIIDEYMKYSKHSHFIQYLSAIESQLKQLYSYIFPQTSNPNGQSFFSVYDRILRHLNLGQLIDVFDLARLIRNLIHSNAVYIDDKKGLDKVITFRGQQYLFEHEKQVKFLFEDLYLDLQEDLFHGLVSIVRHPAIIALQNPIHLYDFNENVP